MTELSFIGKLTKAMAKAKLERAGMELSYFDVVELLGELGSLKLYIAELETKIEERDKPLNARTAELSQAIGLITTLKPTIVMDIEHPLDMAKEVAEYVSARIATLESELATSRQKLTDCDAKIAERDKALNNAVHELSKMEIARDELLREMQWRIENKNHRIAYLKHRIDELEKERDITDETIPERFDENVAELTKAMSERFKDENPEEFFRNLRE